MYYKFALKDILSQKFVCTILFLLFFFTSAAVFAGSIFKQGADGGAEQTQKRLGADVIVVPSGFNAELQNSLFEGKACTFNLDSGWTDKISGIEGVEKISAQRYIATLSADCCAGGGIQLIAYDPDTDFTIGSWLREANIAPPADNEIIVGSDSGFKNGSTVVFFNKEFTVTGRLEKTGMGYDTSAFISLDAARDIAGKDGYSSVFPQKNGREQMSMLMIKTSDGCTPQQVKENIESIYGNENISAFSIASAVSSLSEKISGIKTLSAVYSLFLVITAAIAVFAVITLSIYQRKTVMGRLISVGVTPVKIIRLLIYEYSYIMLAALLCAITVSLAILYPFETYISLSAHIPYRQPGIASVMLTALKTLLINAIMLAAAMLYSAVRLLSRDGGQLIKEDIE